jgi:hypothetical protein
MFPLKPIDPAAIPKALQKAERYRLLNEPEEAESICLDVLAVEPDNQDALTTLLLALTDQFHHKEAACCCRAQELLPRLAGEYERHYYAGLIRERRASAHLGHAGPGCANGAFAWLTEAMACYEKAEALRPPHNDDAILRWNTCARLMQKHDLKPPAEEANEPLLLE